MKEKEKDSFSSNNQPQEGKYPINSTLEKPTSDNHSIRKSNVKKRNPNFSTEQNVTSPKTTETIYLIEKDVDTDALTQGEKENTCAIPASSENISNFVTDNRRFRKKLKAKKKVVNMLKMRKGKNHMRMW